MPVEFSSFPANWRLPLYWVEVDPSMAGTFTLAPPALLVGHKFAGGTAESNVPVAVGDRNTPQGLFGIGSMLERMVQRFFDNNGGQILWCLPIDEPAAGQAATGSITVATPPTDAGTLSLYIAGQLVQVAIGATDTTELVAANIVAAINDLDTLPVTAALHDSSSSQIDLTCRWKGSTGNDIDLRDSYRGSLGGEKLPPGLSLTYPAGNKLSGGTGVPDFTTAIANLGDELYEYVAVPFTDTTSLSAWQTEYGFSSSGRWGWMRQLYGQLYAAKRDTYSNLLVWYAAQNFPECVMAIEPAAPTPIWEWTAAFTGEAAIAFTNDPARPLQTLQLIGCLPAPKHQRFNTGQLNGLASTGAATQQANANNVPQIMRETTMYRLNLYGAPDDAYTDMTTLATLARLLRNQRSAVTSKFPRYKLADDGTRFGPGQAIVTPSIIKAELVAEYALDEFNGLVEDAKVFARNLIVERDSTNPNRVNVLYPPNLIGQLRIFAVLAQFRLLGAQQTQS